MLTLTAIAAALATPQAAGELSTAAAGEPRRARGFALVELYTSEGCSSCPPADVLLSDLVREAREDDTAIYALAFHVPWWDNGAWRDRYSDASYGERQRRYGDALGLETIYTPQVVVNGRAQYVGSDAIKVRSAVVRGLATPAVGHLLVSATSTEDAVTVTLEAAGALDGVTACVALVEDGLSSRVRGGDCLLYTSPSPRDATLSRMPSSA